MLFIIALVPFLLFLRLVLSHGVQPRVLAPLFALILLATFSLVAKPFVAALSAAFVGGTLGVIVLTFVTRVSGVAFVLLVASSILPPYLAVAAGTRVADMIQIDACLDSGGAWAHGECRTAGPPTP